MYCMLLIFFFEMLRFILGLCSSGRLKKDKMNILKTVKKQEHIWLVLADGHLTDYSPVVVFEQRVVVADNLSLIFVDVLVIFVRVNEPLLTINVWRKSKIGRRCGAGFAWQMASHLKQIKQGHINSWCLVQVPYYTYSD